LYTAKPINVLKIKVDDINPFHPTHKTSRLQRHWLSGMDVLFDVREGK